MNMREIVFFELNGKAVFPAWLEDLDYLTRARLMKAILRLANGNFGDYKILTQDLYEMRLFFGGGYRIYYTIRNNRIIIILCGGNKKTQSKDILKAKKYLSLLQEEYYDQKK